MGKIAPAIARRIRHIPFLYHLSDNYTVSKIYNSLVRKRSLQDVPFSTPAGQMQLKLPADERFLTEKSTQEGGHEPFLAEDICKVIDQSSCFLDVGAHMGYFSKLTQQLGVPARNIHAFEPDKFNYYVLSQNCPDINHHNKFVTNTVSSEEISLDEYVDPRFHPDVVKIDAEGAEQNVIDGFTRTIAACHPRLYIEIHPKRLSRFGSTPEEVYEALYDFGYTIDVCQFTREQYPRDDGVWLPPDNSELPSEQVHGIRAVKQ